MTLVLSRYRKEKRGAIKKEEGPSRGKNSSQCSFERMYPWGTQTKRLRGGGNMNLQLNFGLLRKSKYGGEAQWALFFREWQTMTSANYAGGAILAAKNLIMLRGLFR